MNQCPRADLYFAPPSTLHPPSHIGNMLLPARLKDELNSETILADIAIAGTLMVSKIIG